MGGGDKAPSTLAALAAQAGEEHACATKDKFSLQSKKTLRVRVGADDLIWARVGAMIAWTGEKMDFSREGILHGGVGKSLLRAVAKQVDPSENIKLMKCTGNGVLYLAHQKQGITILALGNGEKLTIDGEHLLAFENSVQWKHKFIKLTGGGNRAGGLMQMELTGPGNIAIVSRGPLLALPVGSGGKTNVDPDTVCAWSSNVTYKTERCVKFKAFGGRTSGEEIQMSFHLESGSSGLVLVQPDEQGLEEFV